MRLKKVEEKLMELLMKLSVLIVIASLLLIVGTIIIKGFPSMNLDMITKTPQGGFYMGKEGGILNAIIGSLYLSIGATILALFLSVPVVVYLNIYAPKKSIATRYIRISLDILFGIPSIVFGAFGFILMTLIGLKVSLLAGIITIALLIMPVMIRSMDEVMQTISQDLFDASYSLGATKWQTAFYVLLRQSLPGIATAVLISFGRAVGDAASVLFTAGYTDNIPTSINDPAATLPLAIFFQLSSPVPEVRARAYAAALILTVIILFISITSRLITRKFSKNVI